MSRPLRPVTPVRGPAVKPSSGPVAPPAVSPPRLRPSQLALIARREAGADARRRAEDAQAQDLAIETHGHLTGRRRDHEATDPRPYVLHMSDVRGWAFDVNGRAMQRYLPEIYFEHAYVEDRPVYPDFSRYDAVFLPYHRWHIPRLRRFPRLLGSLRSERFFPERAGPIGPAELEVIDRFKAFYVNNESTYRELVGLRPAVQRLTNPVDTEAFGELTQVTGVVASWNGNAKHGGNADVKGYESVVVPACKLAGVPLNVAEYHTSRLAPREMPAFFRRSSVAICASSYEGASNAVMEAMASGLALVSTEVGNVAELRTSQLKHFGDTGIVLCERSPEAFAAALRGLARDPERVWKMGRINSVEIRTRWSWHAWRGRYLAFFLQGLAA